jgi:hypothetical protein
LFTEDGGEADAEEKTNSNATEFAALPDSESDTTGSDDYDMDDVDDSFQDGSALYDHDYYNDEYERYLAEQSGTN